MARPAPQDAAEFYHGYINHAKGNSAAEVVANHAQDLEHFYHSLPDEKANHAYASDKWTLKELLQHVIDAERVFTYRALRFARKDTTPLCSFDENAYAQHSNASKRTFQSLKDEFISLRNATNIMFSTFDEEQLNSKGTVNNKTMTVNAIAFIVYGHLLHHKGIIEERYLR